MQSHNSFLLAQRYQFSESILTGIIELVILSLVCTEILQQLFKEC